MSYQDLECFYLHIFLLNPIFYQTSVRANFVCATFYPSDREFPCDTKIVLEI